MFDWEDVVTALVFLVWKGAHCLSVLMLVLLVALKVEVMVKAAFGCCGYGRSGVLTRSCQRHSCSPSSWCR